VRKKQNQQQLKLSKQTIRQLSDLRSVVGGCDTTSVTTEAVTVPNPNK
jgi:hypothetical protein